MAIKYTEEQLNTVDKSLIIQMFLNQQEELSKAVNQIEQLTKAERKRLAKRKLICQVFL